MKILAIDTVFDKCGVAVMVDNRIIYQDEQAGKRKQTQQILPMIDKALNASGVKLSELSALVFNRGPGAFSGIRINTAVVQALSFAHDIPCIAVSSLQVLAQSALDNQGIHHGYAVLDARMSQVYISEFKLDSATGLPPLSPIVQLVNDEHLLDYQSITESNLPLCCLSTDDKSLLSLHNNQVYIDNIQPNITTLAIIGSVRLTQDKTLLVSAEHALPVYLRNNAWKTLKEQKQSKL